MYFGTGEQIYQTFMKNKDTNVTYLFMFSPFHQFRSYIYFMMTGTHNLSQFWQ
jgi:hypothetical protein